MSILDTIADRPSLEEIWSHLPQARLVGGCVRDALSGHLVHDFDFASPERPEVVMSILTKRGIKVVPTGVKHGTVTAVLRGQNFEITTLRRDEATDGRHAQVAWTADWREDAARRDFTINAMSCDRFGRIYDFFSGQSDLSEGRVKFVGDPMQRIEEDALRILRFFRFHARFGKGGADLHTLDALCQQREKIDKLSLERVTDEMLRLIAGPNLNATLSLMRQTGVLARVLPEAHLARLARLVACNAPAKPLLRLAALIQNQEVLSQAKLRLSIDHVSYLNALFQIAPNLTCAASATTLRRLLFTARHDVLIDQSWLRQADEVGSPDAQWDALRTRITHVCTPIFPLRGQDILANGADPGPIVGRLLREIENWWVERGCIDDRKACLHQLNELMPLSRKVQQRYTPYDEPDAPNRTT